MKKKIKLNGGPIKSVSLFSTGIGEYLDGSIAKPGLWMMGHVVDPVRLMNDMERMGIKIQMEVTEGNRNTKGGKQ